jgi:ATP-dependent DNA ligase
VALPNDGRSDFGALLSKWGGAEASLMAFDLVRLEGDDLRLRPREALQRLVDGAGGPSGPQGKKKHSGNNGEKDASGPNGPPSLPGAGGILFSEALAAEGAIVFAKACELGLEGIVSKRAGSFYRNGRSRNWLKAKNPNFVRT